MKSLATSQDRVQYPFDIGFQFWVIFPACKRRCGKVMLLHLYAILSTVGVFSIYTDLHQEFTYTRREVTHPTLEIMYIHPPEVTYTHFPEMANEAGSTHPTEMDTLLDTNASITFGLWTFSNLSPASHLI